MSVKSKKHIISFIITFGAGVLGTLGLLLTDFDSTKLTADIILSVGVGAFFGGVRAVLKLATEELLQINNK